MRFYTRFDVAPSINRNKIYDRHDNVDRVSFVDNTRLIQRFILEGENLNRVRARALNSGLYSDVDAFNDNNEVPVIPVYKQDPTIIDPIIADAKNSLKSRAAKRDDESSNDDVIGSSDLTERVSDSKES